MKLTLRSRHFAERRDFLARIAQNIAQIRELNGQMSGVRRFSLRGLFRLGTAGIGNDGIEHVDTLNEVLGHAFMRLQVDFGHRGALFGTTHLLNGIARAGIMPLGNRIIRLTIPARHFILQLAQTRFQLVFVANRIVDTFSERRDLVIEIFAEQRRTRRTFLVLPATRVPRAIYARFNQYIKFLKQIIHSNIIQISQYYTQGSIVLNH